MAGGTGLARGMTDGNLVRVIAWIEANAETGVAIPPNLSYKKKGGSEEPPAIQTLTRLEAEVSADRQ